MNNIYINSYLNKYKLNEFTKNDEIFKKELEILEKDQITKQEILNYKLSVKWFEELLKLSLERLNNNYEEFYNSRYLHFKKYCLPLYNQLEVYNIEDYNEVNDRNNQNKLLLNNINLIDTNLKKKIDISSYIDNSSNKNNKNSLEILLSNVSLYNKCNNVNKEKEAILNNIFEENIDELNISINNCYSICRLKSTKSTVLNCYTKCLHTNITKIPEIEHYIRYIINNLIKEYNQNISGIKNSTLTTSYRLTKRDFTNDTNYNYL